MKLSVVHLSDIHIKNEKDIIFQRVGALANSIQAETAGSDYVIVLTTGDIAFSGSPEEYDCAINLYSAILDSIQTKDKIALFAPGNHDCYHGDAKEKAIRDELIQVIVGDKSKIPTFDTTISSVQANFRSFSELVSGIQVNYDGFCTQFSVPIEQDEQVEIFILNSAWMSEKNEQPGKLIPYKYAPLNDCDAKIRLCAMHHTPNWFNPDDKRDFRQTVETNMNIVFTGHEHEFYSAIKKAQDGKEILFIEGMVLQDSTAPQTSGFNIVHLDTAPCAYTLTTHQFFDGFYSKSYITEEWTKIAPTKSRHRITLSDDFMEYLQDPGVLYMHPRKKELSLEDLYIYPDLRDLDAERKSSNTICIPFSDSSCLFTDSQIKTIILGEEKSGRTSLCKQIYVYQLHNGKIPILLSGQEIKSHKVDAFLKLLRKAFIKQYSEKYADIFDQTDQSRITLIIDDFNKSKLNYKHKALLLGSLEASFECILITADDLFRLEELVTEEIQDFSSRYHFYQIEEFGHLLRSKLISKWNKLGQETYISDEELTRLNDQAKNTIDTVIGKNYVPAFPFFLITILNSMDDPGKKGLAESSYGYYYDYLITGALKRLALKNEDIDALYNYLTELSFSFFDKEISSINYRELNEFHIWYCHEYSLILDQNYYVEMLTKSNIIRLLGEEYSFKYKYYYYYFLARYIAQHLSEKPAQDIVRQMCSSLHLDESSNVIMFLTHLSKNPFVLEQVLLNSKTIFEGNTPTTLQNDVEIINNLIHKLPQIELQDFDVEEKREENFKRKDRIEQNKMDISPDIDKNDQAYELLVSLQKAFKHQEIIGQILKNYYGSLKGITKKELCSEAFELCLRALSDFYNLLNNNLATIVEELKLIIKESGKTKEDKIESVAKKELFHLCEHISYCFIKKIATSIGSENLEGTYKEIVENNPTIANQMIELSIKLDFFRGFPIKEVKALCKNLETNILPYSVLKRLVINYLYMFPTSVSMRQRICDATNISMKCQRAIEATTTQKKQS